ncbi:MAG TPA: M1 family aminopeptidase, partial [Candidatus Polarisedimenticolia bacterium]
KASSAYASIQEGRSVPLTIHSFPTMTMAITDPETLERFGATRPIVFDLSAPTSKVRSFFEESQQILKLFETIYGPYPYDELHIAQMAPQLGFGQAPMGFVQLTGIAFLSQARLESDFVHGFLAHEIAHQWWGHQIGWASDADDWLSESFAEYASGIYVKELQGAKRFQRTLEIWKRNAKVSDAEAPIGEAFTLAGPNGGRHRYNLLYSKGPYVLHMLRVQLGDEKYAQVMRSIQETFRNRSITSEMLLSQVNRATGSDYTSFFEEWVWGTGIPSFRYSWRSEAQPDGRTLVVVHVSQQDKVNVKKVMMPVALHLKGTVQSTTLPIVQAEQDLRILAAAPPKSVTLDDDHTLLADVVKIE